MRSLLFVPADRPERFEKAFKSGADAVCLDLEDAVGAGRKAEARLHVAKALERPTQVQATVRINAVHTDDYESDVALSRTLPDAIPLLLPKAHLDSVQQLLQDVPRRPVIALLEDAQGIEEAYAIANRVDGLVFGGGDLSAQLGACMSWDALLYGRSRLLMAAAHAGCLAIDVPCLALKDVDSIFAETKRVRSLGYRSKAAIHPAQIKPIHQALMPTPAEAEEALAIVKAFEESDGGAVSLNGKMLDAPLLLSARQVLALVGQK